MVIKEFKKECIEIIKEEKKNDSKIKELEEIKKEDN